MCGEPMRLAERESTDRVPGTQQTAVTRVTEWICSECDYFEEADDAGE